MNNILFLFPYPIGQAPSQRFRFEQYFDHLKEHNFNHSSHSFLSQKGWNILYQNGQTLKKIFSVVSGFLRRFFLLFQIYKFDFVFIHREATPIGPPIIEWIIVKIFRKRIIYDFDDAIWIPHISKENSIASKLRWHSKVETICSWSYKVSCGNQFLFDFAKKHNDNVVLMPTTIDMINVHNKRKDYTIERNKLIIGWTGTHSTMGYMDELIPVLEELERDFDFEFRVISDKKPMYNLKSLRFVKWKKSTEIKDLMEFDVGVMPMKDDLWAEGKCGFKALQYMALGIVPIVSPKGVNSSIVEDYKTGFICNNFDEWGLVISNIINSDYDLSNIGEVAFKYVKEHYSVASNKNLFLSLFNLS